MKKHLSLITMASAVALFGASQAVAGGPDKAPAAVSHSHVNFSIEGIHARSNEFSSIVSVTNQTNAGTPAYSTASPDELDAKSTWGWAFDLGYTFDDQSSFNISYRNMKEKMNTATHAYSSVTQILSATDSTLYNGSGTTPAAGQDGSSLTSNSVVIGYNQTNSPGAAAFAVLSATDTLTENAEVKYQQLNFDWGHTFKPASGFYLHPFVGAGWRSIGYKDTVTFASVGAITGTTPTANGGDYITTSTTISSGSNLQLDGSTDTLELASGQAIAASSQDAGFVATNAEISNTVYNGVGEDQIDGATDFTWVDNSTYDITNLPSAMPSYTSKFSGFGPRVGLDSTYTFGSHFGVISGVAFTMPYAKLKVTGTATHFTTRDLAAAGDLTATTTNAQTGVNLQATSGTDTTTISSTDHKFIPEMELHFGLRVANDITLEDNVAYYLEAGYRAIQDWGAVKNFNLKGTTTSTTSGTQTTLFGNSGAGYSYSSITNFGPYLKAGITFGT